jgi:hypothetical protein
MECGKPMDPIDAQQWENCRDCRKQHGYRKVRSISRRGTEHVGRSARNPKTLGGVAEFNNPGDESPAYPSAGD